MEPYGLAIRIDWFRVLADLNYQGLRSQQIADRIQVARTTVVGWKQGAEPKHADGETLLELWVAITGKPRKYAPRVQPFPSAFPVQL